MRSPYLFSWVNPIRVIVGISGRHFRSERYAAGPARRLSIRGFARQRQRKMQDKQGRDAASVPVMLEVPVHRDGGLWRPVLWKGRRRLTEMQAAKTSRNDALSIFSEGPSTTPLTCRRITPYRRRDSSHRTGPASLPPPHPRYTAAPRPLAASLLPWPFCACGRPS